MLGFVVGGFGVSGGDYVGFFFFVCCFFGTVVAPLYSGITAVVALSLLSNRVSFIFVLLVFFRLALIHHLLLPG